MINLLKTEAQRIEEYCEQNNLSIEKVFKGFKCIGDCEVYILRDEGTSVGFLDDSKHAEVLLKIEKIENKLLFTPYENMHKYLS